MRFQCIRWSWFNFRLYFSHCVFVCIKTDLIKLHGWHGEGFLNCAHRMCPIVWQNKIQLYQWETHVFESQSMKMEKRKKLVEKVHFSLLKTFRYIFCVCVRVRVGALALRSTEWHFISMAFIDASHPKLAWHVNEAQNILIIISLKAYIWRFGEFWKHKPINVPLLKHTFQIDFHTHKMAMVGVREQRCQRCKKAAHNSQKEREG